MSSKSKKIAVVGAGYTGLAAAYELAKNGYSVDVYEASDAPGGLAGDFDIEGASIELAYHHIFTTDKYIINLAKQTGSYKYLKWLDSSVAIYQHGKLYPFKTAIDLLKFKPLKLHNRIRAGIAVLYLQKYKQWQKLQGLTAVEWLNKYAGKQVYEVIWEPLLKGKFDKEYKHVSMAWLWARVNTRANSREKGKGEQLGYFVGGFKVFTDGLAKACKKNGVRFFYNSKVNALLKGPTVKTAAGQLKYDAVIVTAPTNIFWGLVNKSTPQGYLSDLKKVKYLDALLLIFSSSQELTPYYWHNVNDKDIPFLVFINHTKLMDKKHYGNKNIYYIAAYLDKNSRYLKLDEKTLQAEWFKALRKMFPTFDKTRVSRAIKVHLKDAQHIVDTKYSNYIPDIKTPINGVYLSNFSQIYPEDRGTNFAIKAGQDVAKMLHNDITNSLPE